MNQKICDLCRYLFIGVETVYFVSTGQAGGLLGSKKQKADICINCYKDIVTHISKMKK